MSPYAIKGNLKIFFSVESRRVVYAVFHELFTYVHWTKSFFSEKKKPMKYDVVRTVIQASTIQKIFIFLDTFERIHRTKSFFFRKKEANEIRCIQSEQFFRLLQFRKYLYFQMYFERITLLLRTLPPLDLLYDNCTRNHTIKKYMSYGVNF